MGALVLPLYPVALHQVGELLFLRAHPLAPLRVPSGAALETLGRQCLFQRYPCVQPPLAPGSERHKVDVQMGRGLVHVEVGREHPEIGIALLKRFHILVQHHRRQPPFVAVGAHVVLVAHLQDNFVKRFFLFAGADFFIVVFYPPVCPGLFGVVAFQGLVKEFMVHRLDILLAVCYIQMGAFRVGILSVKLPAVVVH